MRYNRVHKALILCIAFNIVVFLYLFLSQHGVLESDSVLGNSLASISVTVVIYEFENFENDLTDTVISVLNGLPDAKVVIVTKKNPYPPLDITHKNVKIVVVDQPASNPALWGDPKSFIQSKYVMVVPDAVRLSYAKRLDYKAIFQQSTIIAFPVDGSYECSELNVDLRAWTISYRNKEGDHICDPVAGRETRSVLLMPTTRFFNLSEPFIRPSLDSLFIQFSLRGWKTFISKERLFSAGKRLFLSDHNRWKAKQKREQRLRSMYERFGIKLVNQNGVDKWYGCNKNTPRCFGTVVDDMPEYIYNDRWTPPCCMRNLKETARYVFKILVDNGVKYWLEGGSLLGAVRNHDIIPWDYDVDIGIYQNEITKCPQLKKVEESGQQRFIDDNGFVWEKAKEGEFYRVQFSEINHLHVDIFPFYERNGVMTKDTWLKTHRQDTEFPAHYLKPLATIDFIGIKAYVPNNYRQFLEMKFGKGVIENPQFPNPKKAKKKPKDVVP